jgi:hypothetical protein
VEDSLYNVESKHISKFGGLLVNRLSNFALWHLKTSPVLQNHDLPQGALFNRGRLERSYKRHRSLTSCISSTRVPIRPNTRR